jgi:hypothetical protein
MGNIKMDFGEIDWHGVDCLRIGTSERCDEPSDCIRCWEVLEWQLLKKGSAPWS